MNKIKLQSGNKEFDAKEQLYALFYELTSEIKGKEIELDEDLYINNINTITIPQLIKYLRDTIQILIKKQVDCDKELLPQSQSPLTEEERRRYEHIVLHLEANERNHIRRHFEENGTKEILESKLMEFIEMEKEYDALKEKVKYEEGRFLKNERKDNEIIIIRSENTILKKAILDLEEKEKTFDKEITERDVLIDQLKETVEEYRTELERTKKDLKLFSNININISNTGNNTAISNNNNNSSNNQVKCSLCGSQGNKSPEKVEQTQLKMFTLKKVNAQSQKPKIHYNLNQMNGSLSNTHITFDLLSNKASSSSNKNITLQHNNSMNLMSDRCKADSLNKNCNSSRLKKNNKNINPYCMKITKLPINQSRCPIINNSSLTSKRDQVSNKVVLAKKPSALINNNKSHLNSTTSRGEL